MWILGVWLACPSLTMPVVVVVKQDNIEGTL